MNVRVNWRFLIVFTVASALTLGGYFALHAAQVRRQAGLLPALADRYAEEGKTARALRTLNRYLLAQPGDDAQRLHYARLLIAANPDAAGVAKAAEALTMVLQGRPADDGVRSELAHLLVNAGQWADSLQHLERLSAGGDAWAAESLGRVYAVLGRWGEVERLLTPVCLDAKGAFLADYARLAEALRRLNRVAPADEVMDKLVADHDTASEAYLIRAGYRARYAIAGAGADDDLDRAKSLAPEDPAVAVALATRSLERRDPEAALAELKGAMVAWPNDVRLLRLAAAAESQSGRPVGAIDFLRRAVKARPQDAELVLNLAQALVDAGDFTAAKAQLASARGFSGAAADDAEFLSARLRLEAGDWPAAATTFQALRPKFAAAKKPTAPIDALLARCMGLAGDGDRQLLYARQAAAGGETPGLMALASAQAQSGRFDEALANYNTILRGPKPPAAAAFGAAQILVIRLGTLGTAAKAGDWAEVERLLDRAGAAAPDAWEIPVLRAEALIAQDKADEARKILKDARAKTPSEVALWAASAAAEARAGAPQAAETLLDEGEKRTGDCADLRLTRLRVRFAGQGDKFAAVEAAGRELGAISGDDRIRIWSAQAEGYRLLNKPAQTADVLDKILAERPNDLRSLLARFDAAILQNDKAGADRVLAEMRRLDGAQGAISEYVAAYRAVREFREKPDDKALLAEARRHLGEASARRPRWAKAALLRAEVEELDGNADRAAEAFREAIEGGERSFELLRRLAAYYAERGRFVEADDLIKRIQEKGPLNSSQSRIAAEMYLRASDYARALDLARQAVADDSKNASDLLWLARVSFAARRPAGEVEAALRKATAVAGDSPEPWVALVRYLADTGRKSDARLVTDQVAKSVAFEKAAPILAACHEAAGEIDRADAAYVESMANAPGDLRVAQGAAAFFARVGRWSKAEAALTPIVQGKTQAGPEDVAAARRDLAVALVGQGGNRAKEAEKLLPSGGAATPADTRARALVLSQNRMTQRAAFELLDAEFSRRPLPSSDLFLYARLAWATEQPAVAAQAMTPLLGAEKGKGEYLEFWVDAQMNRGDLLDARYSLSQLVKLQPRAFETIRLDSLLRFKQGKVPEAASLLKEYAPRSLPELAQLAAAHEMVDDFEQAEKRFREYAEKAGSPPARLALGQYLGRRSRYAEALDIFDAARHDLPPDLVATIAVDLLRSGQKRPEAAQVGRVERWLSDAQPPKERPWQPIWLLAELADIRGESGRAIKLFRQALDLAPAQPLVVPGLARLLCLTGGPAEAAEAGQLAAEAGAPMPSNADELAELEGLALLKRGKAAEAVQKLQAVGRTAPSPRCSFYLAAAQLAAGQKDKAILARDEALMRGLKEWALNPLEEVWWKTLIAELNR